MICFGENSSRTDDAFSALTRPLQTGGSVTARDFPESFSCERKVQLAGAVTQLYKNSRREATKSGAEDKSPAVAGQLEAVTNLVEDLREQLKTIRRPEPVVDGLAAAVLELSLIHI